MADAPDLGSGGEILRGSSPLPGTSKEQTSNIKAEAGSLGVGCWLLDVRRPLCPNFCIFYDASLAHGRGEPIDAMSNLHPRALSLSFAISCSGLMRGPGANTRSSRSDMSSLTRVPPISTTRTLLFISDRRSGYRPSRTNRCKALFRSGFVAVLAGQHSTISSARNRNSIRRADFKSSRRFFAICWTDRMPLNCDANCASSEVSFSF